MTEVVDEEEESFISEDSSPMSSVSKDEGYTSRLLEMNNQVSAL